MRKILMLVPMMQIRPMRMSVADGRMLMHVAVLNRINRRFMIMVMMQIIMSMSMIVKQRLVGMPMIMSVTKHHNQSAD